MTEKKILAYLRGNLPKDRLGHVMGVAFLAQKAAQKHGLDPKRARLAALLHDAARCWKSEDLVRYVRQHELKIPNASITMKNPILLHSYVGADLARKLFGVRDPEILSAIANHTLGAPGMSAFEKCIYLADLAAPDRKFQSVKKLREILMGDLDLAFLEGLRVKMGYTIHMGHKIHPRTFNAWNSVAPGP